MWTATSKYSNHLFLGEDDTDSNLGSLEITANAISARCGRLNFQMNEYVLRNIED